MGYLERYRKRLSVDGDTVRDENRFNSIQVLKNTFYDDPSFNEKVFRWKYCTDTYDETQKVDIRLYDRKFSNANGEQIKFQTLFDTPIDVGDILYDAKMGHFLICTESFNINDIHWQGKFNVCNWILKWQNRDGIILQYPCYNINSTQYNSGETPNKIFTTGSSQYMLTLPCDENTVVLSTPQRFYIDKNTIKPTSFIVTQNDTTSYAYGKKGLCKVTVVECANDNDSDRPDLGICDYFEPHIVVEKDGTQIVEKYSDILFETTIIKSGGDSKTFIGKFFDDSGKEIANAVPVWDIICDFKDSLIIEKTGNQISIAIDDDLCVDEVFKLTLTDEKGNCYSDLIVRIESLL